MTLHPVLTFFFFPRYTRYLVPFALTLTSRLGVRSRTCEPPSCRRDDEVIPTPSALKGVALYSCLRDDEDIPMSSSVWVCPSVCRLAMLRCCTYFSIVVYTDSTSNTQLLERMKISIKCRIANVLPLMVSDMNVSVGRDLRFPSL